MTERQVRPAPPAPDVQGLARGGLVSLLGAAVSAVSGVGVVLILTRTLSKTDAGVFFGLTSLALIAATVARLGTPTGLVYFLSGGRALQQQGRERDVLALALKPVVVVSVVTSVCLVGAAPLVVETLGLDGQDQARAPEALRMLAVFIPFMTVSEVFLSSTRGLGSMRPTVLLDRIGRCGAQLVLVVVAAYTSGSLLLITLAWALPYFPVVLLARRTFLSQAPHVGEPPPGSAVGRRQFWRFTAPRSITSVVQIALQRLDVLLVAALLGPVEAAVYAAASRIVVLGQLGNQAVSLAAQPRLRAALAKGERSNANALYRTATSWLVLLTWPTYLLAMMWAEPLLRLFGNGYEEGYQVLLVLACAMLLATACGMVDMVLSMAGRTTWNLWNGLVALFINVTVDLLLIPEVGIVGAAIGWALAIAVSNLLALGQIAWSSGVHPFGRAIVVAVSLSLLSFAVIPMLGLLLAGPDGQAWGVLAGLGIYLAGCRWQRKVLELGVLYAVLRPGAKVST